MPDSLKDFARRTSAFAQFDENGVIEGFYGGWKTLVKDSFGKEKEVVRYKIDDKTFDSTSGSLANQMSVVKEGQRVRIVRTGKGMETKYKVEIIQSEPVEW